MEKHYTDGLGTEEAIRLAVQTLGEIVEGSEHLDICCMHKSGKIETVPDEVLAEIFNVLKQEKEAAEAAKKKKAD